MTKYRVRAYQNKAGETFYVGEVHTGRWFFPWRMVSQARMTVQVATEDCERHLADLKRKAALISHGIVVEWDEETPAPKQPKWVVEERNSGVWIQESYGSFDHWHDAQMCLEGYLKIHPNRILRVGLADD